MVKLEYPVPIETINGPKFRFLMEELGVTQKLVGKFFGTTQGSVSHRIQRNVIRTADVQALREIVGDDEAFYFALRKLKLKISPGPKTITELKILVEVQDKRIETLKSRIEELEDELEIRKKKRFKEKGE